MAGRPKMMFSKVGGLVDRFYALSDELFELMPNIYRPEAKPNVRDPVCNAWNRAIEATAHNVCELASLQEQLLIKAGVRPPGNLLVTIDDETTTLAGWCTAYGVEQEDAIDRWQAGCDWEKAILTAAERAPDGHLLDQSPVVEESPTPLKAWDTDEMGSS